MKNDPFSSSMRRNDLQAGGAPCQLCTGRKGEQPTPAAQACLSWSIIHNQQIVVVIVNETVPCSVLDECDGTAIQKVFVLYLEIVLITIIPDAVVMTHD